VKEAIKEAARCYAKLRKMDVPVEYLDIGGGLGVDYDGSKTSFDSSMNYTVQEYANDVVYTVQEICHNETVPEPTLVSESGRNLTAYHTVVVIQLMNSFLHKENGTASPPLPGHRADHQ